MYTENRKKLRNKQRIVVKIGSSSLTHAKTGELNLLKIEKLVRILCDLRGEGRDVVLVSSGAIAAGRLLADKSVQKVFQKSRRMLLWARPG